MLVVAFAHRGLFAFLAGSAFVFVTVMGQGETDFGLLFGAVMLGNVTGATIGIRLVRRWGIDKMIRRASILLVVAGLAVARSRGPASTHPLAVVVPMFFYMVALMTTMPQAIAGALTPFPQIAGAASSLLSFVQFVTASTAALAVGLAVRRHVAGDGDHDRGWGGVRLRRVPRADRAARRARLASRRAVPGKLAPPVGAANEVSVGVPAWPRYAAAGSAMASCGTGMSAV